MRQCLFAAILACLVVSSCCLSSPPPQSNAATEVAADCAYDFAVVDLSRPNEEIIGKLKTAMKDVGFFYLTGIPHYDDHLTLKLYKNAQVSQVKSVKSSHGMTCHDMKVEGLRKNALLSIPGNHSTKHRLFDTYCLTVPSVPDPIRPILIPPPSPPLHKKPSGSLTSPTK